MFGNLTDKAHFRVTSGQTKILDNLCERNDIPKKSDLQRMAYMTGMAVVYDMEQNLKEGEDLMIELAKHIVSKKQIRVWKGIE